MDTHIILTWSITILATLSFVVYFYLRNRNREKRSYSVMQSFAKENNSTVSSFDHWVNTLIGIDQKETNKLFFIRTANNHAIREVINLSEVSACRLSKAERSVTNDREKVHVIDRVELVFTFFNQNRPAVVLEFYNNDYDSLTLTGELQLSQKWLGIVNSIVLSNKNRKKEAGNSKLPAASSLNKPGSQTSVAAYPAKGKLKQTA